MKTSYNILGIGKVGYNLSKCFEKYSQYNVYKIDIESRKEKRYYKIPKQKNIIEYEKNVPNLKNFFKSMKGELLVILEGSEDIVGSTLSILSQVKDRCKISILFIVPDITFLSEIKKKQNEIAYNVLQQYARSNVFKQITIISSEILENQMVDIQIEKKNIAMNEHISYCFHMINAFKNIQSMEDNFEEPFETSKIVSIGYNLLSDEMEDKLFFLLDNVREKRYYFAISEKTISENKTFYKKIKDMIKTLKERDESVKIEYGIFKTQHEQDFVFLETRSWEIQK